MIIENAHLRHRFFLRAKTRYYHDSGTQDVGTEYEAEYINWTRYLDEARGFDSIRAARRMAKIIQEKHGKTVYVVDRHGEAV